MSDKVRVLPVIEELKARKGNIRCEEVCGLLSSLGFDIKDGKSPGHKIFTHQGLPAFYSGSFNCGHGRNPEIKPAYITKVIRVLSEHQEALDRLLKEGNGND
jgi:hypothetical protein